MKNIIFISIIFILLGCINGGDPNISIPSITTIVNDSEHNIELQVFQNGVFQSVIMIDNNKKYSIVGDFPFHPPLLADSIWIIYFNKASIWHTTNVNSHVSRSLMLESSYIGDKVKDGMQYTYTFTPADYEEALEFGD